MASEADIPAPTSETRREETEKKVDQPTHISLHKVPDEEITQGEKLNELPATLECNSDVIHVENGSGDQNIEGEHFLKSPSIVEDPSVANKVAEKPDQAVKDDTESSLLGNYELDDQQIKNIAIEDNFGERSQQDAECSPLVGLDDKKNLAEKVSQEKVTPTETINDETSYKNELQRKSETGPSSLQENTPIHEEASSVTTPDDSKPLEDIFTIHSHQSAAEKTEENSSIQDESSQVKDDEGLEKENDNISVPEASRDDSNNDSSTVNLLESENITQVKEEPIEKPSDFSHLAVEDIKETSIGETTETTPLEDSLTAISKEVLGDKADEKTADSVDFKEECVEAQNVARIASNKETEESSTIEEDDLETKNKECLEEESTEPPAGKSLIKDDRDVELGVIHEPKIENEESELSENQTTESLLHKVEAQTERQVEISQIVPDDTKTTASSQNETPITLDEDSLPTDLREIPADISDHKTKDAVKEETIESVAADVPLTKQEDTFNEESEKPSASGIWNFLTKPFAHAEASTEDSYEDKPIVDHKIEGEDLRTAELLNEKDTECTLLKEEVQEEKPVESLDVASEDIKANASSQDIDAANYEDRSLSTTSQGILDEKAEDKTIDEVDVKDKTLDVQSLETIVSNEDIQEKSLIQVDGSLNEPFEKETEKTGLAEASTDADLTEKIAEDDFSEESEKPSKGGIWNFLTKPFAKAEASTTDNNEDESIIMHHKIEGEDLRTAELLNEKNYESNLLKEEVQEEKPVESLDVKPYASSKDTTNYFEDQSLSTTSQEIQDEKTEEKTIDEIDINDRTLDVQSFTTIVPNEDIAEKSLIQVDGSQNEPFEKETEKTCLAEDSTGFTNADLTESKHEAQIEDVEIKKSELNPSESNVESNLLKKEATLERSIEYLHAAPENIEASSSGQDTDKTIVCEDESLPADPQRILVDNLEERTVDDIDTKEETLENVSRAISNEETCASDQDTDTTIPLKEETLEIQNIPRTVSTEEIEEKSVVHLDDSQVKHDEQFDDSEKPEEKNTQETQGIQVEDYVTDVVETKEKNNEDEVRSLEEIIGDKTEDKVINASDIEEIHEVHLPGEEDICKPEEGFIFDSKEIIQDKDDEKNTEVVNLRNNEEFFPDTQSSALSENVLEEVLHVNEVDICSQNDQLDSVENRDQENSVALHDAIEDQSKETKNERNYVVDHIIEKKMQEDHETATKEEDVDLQVTDNQGHIAAQSEATADEIHEPFQEKRELEVEYSSGSEGKFADSYDEEKTITEIPIKEVQEIHKESDESIESSTHNIEDGEEKNNVAGSVEEKKEAETCKDDNKSIGDPEVLGKFEYADSKAKTSETSEQEASLDELQRTSVNITTPEETGIDSEEVVVYNPKDLNFEQEKLSITEDSEEEVQTISKKFVNENSLVAEVSEENNDEKSVGKSSYNEKRELDDDTITIPDNKILAEADQEGIKEAQILCEEKEGEIKQHSVAETIQKEEKEQLGNASQEISDANEVCGEEKSSADYNKETIENSNFVVSDEVLSTDPYQETKRESLQDMETKEAQEQYQDLPVSAFIKDLIFDQQKDDQLCFATSEDSDITQEVQKLEEASLSAPNDEISERTFEEKEFSKDTDNNEYMVNLEKETTTKDITDDLKKEEEENQKTIRSDETKDLTQPEIATDVLEKSFHESSPVEGYSTDEKELTTKEEEIQREDIAAGEIEEARNEKEKEVGTQEISDCSSEAPVKIETRGEDVATFADEASGENSTSGVGGEIINLHEAADTKEIPLIKKETSLNDILVDDKSVEKLETKENTETKFSTEEKGATIIQREAVLDTFEHEAEVQQPEITYGVSETNEVECEEKKIPDDIKNSLTENSTGVSTDKVSPSNILQGSTGGEAEGAENQETQKHCEVLPVLPIIQSPDVEIEQKDLPLLKATPPTANDKHVVLEADHTENAKHESSVENKNVIVTENEDSVECSKVEGERLNPSKPDQEEKRSRHKEKTNDETERLGEGSVSTLSDLPQVSTKGTKPVADHCSTEKDQVIHKEELQEEKLSEEEHEGAETDEEKDDEECSGEHKKSDSGSEGLVMVEAGDADVKVTPKKPHNILSGVGSKVKHSLAKVKKAITGKSSHTKPISPK